MARDKDTATPTPTPTTHSAHGHATPSPQSTAHQVTRPTAERGEGLLKIGERAKFKDAAYCVIKGIKLPDPASGREHILFSCETDDGKHSFDATAEDLERVALEEGLEIGGNDPTTVPRSGGRNPIHPRFRREPEPGTTSPREGREYFMGRGVERKD